MSPLPETPYPPASWLTRRSAAMLAGVTVRTITRWQAEGLLNWGLGRRGPQPVPVFCPSDIIAAADSKRPARPRVRTGNRRNHG